eukprot:CAMPEP_0116938526 /NCGR_PEP_ID=MMETSP0467-20121206/32180_1 /TAXON_ID=283647 /ORGANISM="Mesodinium pulex, Strain SPMC105" /LENGTH=116 /DNA_ID=CAMNT_0004620605 /DNA_START=273 /DNA_END=623 /DNA_ORIENTATION=-
MISNSSKIIVFLSKHFGVGQEFISNLDKVDAVSNLMFDSINIGRSYEIKHILSGRDKIQKTDYRKFEKVDLDHSREKLNKHFEALNETLAVSVDANIGNKDNDIEIEIDSIYKAAI